ncbi:MAG: PTS sugar transporter subunit IIA [Culicoidibacterales bacterium]
MGLFDFLKKKQPQVQETVEHVTEKVAEVVEGVKSAVGAEEVTLDVLELGAITEGEVVDLTEVPDPVFAQKMMGEGYGILSTTGTFVAPCDGEVTLVFPTKHAIGFKSERGDEILLHVGLDTVSLNGEGFEVFVEQGDKVKKGDKISQADLSFIESKGLKTITPCVVSDMTGRTVELVKTGAIAAGETVATITLSK